MKRISLFLLIVLLLPSLSLASSYFRIVDVSPIQLYPGTEANFTVTVRGLGSEGQYAKLLFKDLPPGLSVVEAGGMRYIYPAGTRAFVCRMKAEGVTEGNYSLQIGILAKDAPYSWRTAFAVVSPERKLALDLNASGSQSASQNTSSPAPGGKQEEGCRATPAGGALAAAAALLLARRAAYSCRSHPSLSFIIR
jgi:hypothetical protein